MAGVVPDNHDLVLRAVPGYPGKVIGGSGVPGDRHQVHRFDAAVDRVQLTHRDDYRRGRTANRWRRSACRNQRRLHVDIGIAIGLIGIPISLPHYIDVIFAGGRIVGQRGIDALVLIHRLLGQIITGFEKFAEDNSGGEVGTVAVTTSG